MSYLPPTRKEAVIVLVSTLSFLLLTAVFIGLRPEHVAMAVVLDVLLFASLYTRKLVVALLPFVVFAVSYDWMRVWPNYMVNDIDVAGLYSAERTIFGIDVDGVRMTLCEFFHEHHCSVADFFAGLFYLCWVPVPVLFALSLFIKGRRELALRFSLVFLLVNLIGFAGYYIHPAAPPWYVMQYGFEPILGTPGNVAGLGRLFLPRCPRCIRPICRSLLPMRLWGVVRNGLSLFSALSWWEYGLRRFTRDITI